MLRCQRLSYVCPVDIAGETIAAWHERFELYNLCSIYDIKWIYGHWIDCDNALNIRIVNVCANYVALLYLHFFHFPLIIL